ncbi:MATE family efflux transporter [Mobilisporobacter senegalensis]|nr:MATE family efflux transporter [Mobilisporobacter senegalensis]
MFTRKDLQKLIFPLIIEQVLAITVGMADIIMVAKAGEAAASGVSLVDTINILLINIFAALATGGAVVSAQFLGHDDKKSACKSANQILITVFTIAVTIMLIALIGNKEILSLAFGNVETDVMNNARLYFLISAFSYPFLGLYNACAALFRSMGNSKVSMYISFGMNGINIIGNAIFLYGFHAGVEGVAIPTLISRITGAIIMLLLIRNTKYNIHIGREFSFKPDFTLIKKILRIGVPNGLENSMFQIGKVIVQSLIASFGTTAIAGNAIANTVASFEIIPGSAIGLALITVVGQCVGAGELEQAKYYTIKLMKITFIIMGILNVIIALLCGPIVNFYHFSKETTEIAYNLIMYHSVVCIFIWPLSFTLPNALRAASDVKFTMMVSIISMWVWRIIFSYVLGKYYGLGVLGIWIAMTLDWLFRGSCFVIRFLKGKWRLAYSLE